MKEDWEAAQGDEARARRVRDFNDLQDENAGRDTGKQLRFTPPESSPQGLAARRDKDRLFWNAQAELSLRIARLRERLDELDRAAERALRRADERLRETQEQLDRARANAATDEHGNRVYFTRDGKRAFYEDGSELTAQQRAAIHAHEGATTWEEQTAADAARLAARDKRDAVQDYRDRLSDARQRIDDGEPLDEQALDDLEARLDAMPDEVRAELESPGPGARRTVSAAATSVPDSKHTGAPPLNASFEAAIAALPSSSPGERAPPVHPLKPEGP